MKHVIPDLNVTWEPIRVHSDARGAVFEPLEPDALPSQKNVHVVVNEPGAIRGNHYHQRGSEVLVVTGPAVIRVKKGATVHDVEVPDGAVYQMCVPPGISHAIQNTGNKPGVLVAFNSEIHDPAGSDTFRDVIL